MKKQLTFMLLSAALFVLLPPPAFAQDAKANSPLEGFWKWTFTMPDGSQVTPRLELREEAGRLTGTTRLRPGSEAPITNLTVQGDAISFEVVREREGRVVVTHYAGTLSGDTIQGKITSNSEGAEQNYDWVAKRSPDANGAWKWSSRFGGATVESRLTLKQEGEKLTGKLSGARGADMEIKKGKFKAGEISFQTERERDGETFVSRYYGKLSGNKILGKMELNFFGQPRTNTWEAVRAD